MSILINNINFLLKQKKWTLDQWSNQMQIPKQRISQWLNGLSAIDAYSLLPISQSLQIPIEKLLSLDLSIPQKKIKVKMVVCDVDGVLTDGQMIYNSQGIESKNFNCKDGIAVQKLRENNIEVALLSSGYRNEVIAARAETLQIERWYVGREQKINILEQWLEECNVGFDECAYIGDDINDITCMTKVALSACPNDAVSEIKNIATIVLQSKGGTGCLRELTDNYIL